MCHMNIQLYKYIYINLFSLDVLYITCLYFSGNEPELQPVFQPAHPDGTTPNVRGRFILNHYGRVLSRFGQQRAMPKNLQCLLQSVFAKHPQTQVSLNFFEGVLFPYLFPFQYQGSIVGSLPHSMFLDPLKQSKRGRHIATLQEHMNVRSQDLFAASSTEADYASFAFDILLNEKLTYNSASLALKKGPEFLSKSRGDGVDVGQKDMSMLFDRVEAHGPVNELAAFIKAVGKSDYFVTVTANQQRTPGLAALWNHIQEYRSQAQLSDWNYQAMVTGLTSIFVQTFYRTIRYMWHWIAHGGDQPLGPVKCYWFR